MCLVSREALLLLLYMLFIESKVVLMSDCVRQIKITP